MPGMKSSKLLNIHVISSVPTEFVGLVHEYRSVCVLFRVTCVCNVVFMYCKMHVLQNARRITSTIISLVVVTFCFCSFTSGKK